jgi:lipopolysaccharide transport periplasmic protein lptA
MVLGEKIVKFSAFFALFMGVINAEQVQVTADNFFADENKQISTLNGNVVIKKGAYDTLNSDKVDIFFDANRQPIKYVATGNARFRAMMKDNKYSGKGAILTYEPASQTYTLSGSAYLHDETNKREVFGEKIIVNQLNSTYEVKSANSKNAPAKLIFEVEEKNNDKK